MLFNEYSGQKQNIERMEMERLRMYLLDFDEQKIMIPDHQRKAGIWKPKKQIKFIQDIINSDRTYIPGIIMLYKINGYGQYYINDGLQRTSVLIECKKHPEKFNTTKEIFEKVIESISIAIQHYNFKSHRDAAIMFVSVNSLGSTLTASELYKHYLAYGDKNKVEHLNDVVYREIAACDDYVSKSNNERLTSSKHLRDMYCLFHRFITKNDSMHPALYTKNNSFDYSKSEDLIVEKLLAEEIEKYTFSEFINLSKRFTDMVHRIKAVVKEYIPIINERVKLMKGNSSMNIEEINAISFSYWRSIIAYWIYSQNRNIPIKETISIIQRSLFLSYGDTQRVYEYEDGFIEPKIKIGLQCLSPFVMLEKNRIKRDAQNTNNMAKGYDKSHKEHFSLSGNGETFIEPSSLNRSRGNREPVFI